jgi:hypothetical protein
VLPLSQEGPILPDPYALQHCESRVLDQRLLEERGDVYRPPTMPNRS